MNEEILKDIRERGLLLEKEIFDLLASFSDIVVARELLTSLEQSAGQKFITKSVLSKNVEYIKKVVNQLPGENKDSVESVFVRLGISLEVHKEREVREIKELAASKATQYQVYYADTKATKKLEVGDFTGNFRARYQQLQRILMQRADLTNLTSINKISSDRQSLSIIGMVKEKRVTKNKNMIISFEDLTGEIGGMIKMDKPELFAKAQELQLDDVVGIKASGNKDLLFVHELYFPDSIIENKMRFDDDACIAFLSDVHAGSKKHLPKSFSRFLEWINGNDSLALKIRYIFFLGDNVDGVGIFPGQEHLLALKSMKEQYDLLASYLKQIPKRINIFMCPGQHDACRVAEPQPIIDRKYASALYELENLTLVTNPALVKLIEGKKEFNILMYHGASLHSFINEIAELREQKANLHPAKAVKHILKRRHLAPTHSSVIYIPSMEKDPLVISEVPDVMCTGDMHRCDIDIYNGVLIITGSCWQSQTDFEEKVGNVPDPAKVSVLNLKTRELNILDFLDSEEAVNGN
ncbi:metallophosphoesterase [Candidatus Pacearchaeota archaeon]|nr:metallophosphoesterase [Candidatus Pacearchaeota archaeon]